MGYHKNKQIPLRELSTIKEMMKNTKKLSDIKRLQCVYLRGLNHDIDYIQEVTQFSAPHIRHIWRSYFKEGLSILISKPKGGRVNCMTSLENEERLLNNYFKDNEAAIQSGHDLTIKSLHQYLCQQLDCQMSLSTAYNIAHRQGWRKVVPRPFHKKRDQQAVNDFKIFFSREDKSSETDRPNERKTVEGVIPR